MVDTEWSMAGPMRVGATHDPAERKAEQGAGQRPARDLASEPAYVAPGSVERAVTGAGQPLDPGVRKDMSRRLGYDFSQVRIHADTDAARSAEHISAAAYTVGDDIAFAPGRYEPKTEEGSRLLAHELAHVAQGDGATVRPYRDRGSQNFGKADQSGLVESAFKNPADKEKLPWIENVTVTFTGTDTDAAGNTFWKGTAVAKYYANAVALPDLVLTISGGSDTLGATTGGNNFTVTRIEGLGYNSGKYSGKVDKSKREGPNLRYSKPDPADGSYSANMHFAVFYHDGEALHSGSVGVSSHGCVHVDETSNPLAMQQLNYHAVTSLTKVKVAYPKKP